MIEGIILGLVGGLGLWLLVSSFLPPPRPTLTEFLVPYVHHASSAARELARHREHDPIIMLGHILSPSLASVVRRFNAITGGPTTYGLLIASGAKESRSDFYSRRGIAAILGGLLSMAVVSAVTVLTGTLGPLNLLVAGILGVGIGVWVVDSRVKAHVKERADRIAEEFPLALEMLGLALAAGDSFPRALERLARRMSGELGRDWARVIMDVDSGRTMEDCLRESSRRLGDWRVTRFLDHVIQALERGTPLRDIVDSHAEDATQERTRTLVERGGKAEVQMLVPMVLLILPVTVLFAVWPGLRALEAGF